ncbi:MAG: 5'-nucleotidase C-terminal domain-containing protein [Candidatus Rokubacteria bacterium]|nr:5'-nucleotidase C-terminal domain-containing protein [Candidatus Rokubacteria bacterium]MBI2157261.1 5'-nucleotidase C-terminal domain-containing protein [Candidatus Rokubacteria bacterium]
MRRRALALLLLAALLAGCASAPGARSDGDLVRITLLQVNDIYVLEPVDDARRGGMARLATLVHEARRRSPHTVFALPGDFLSPSVMSTFLRGEHMVAALDALGLDLATFGNHEFDFGPEVLRDRMSEAKFRWLSANVVDRRTGEPFGGALRDWLTELGGLRVGFFGLTTPETAATSNAGPDVVFADPLAAGQAAAARLRARGAHLVVAVTHQDMAQDRALAGGADVDVILGGHEHEPLVAEEGKTLVTKGGSDGRYLVQVDLWLTREGTLVERSWRFREPSARVAPDPAVAELVQAYTLRLDRDLDAPVGRTAVPLDALGNALRTRETNLGSFIADLVRERTRTDVALVNGGGIRTNRTVPAGPLTKRDVHGLLPFTNVIVTLELAGRTLREALEHGLAQADREGGGFLQVSGLRLAHDPGRPAGGRLVSVEVGGRPLDDAARYTVAVPRFLARGGDGFAMLPRARVLVGEASGPDMARLVLDAIAARGTIAPAADGRLRSVRDQ